MAEKRSRFTINLVVETFEESVEDHEKYARWVYSNMLRTNEAMRDVFYIASVRNEEGELLEFVGSGKKKPSEQMSRMFKKLVDEGQ